MFYIKHHLFNQIFQSVHCIRLDGANGSFVLPCNIFNKSIMISQIQLLQNFLFPSEYVWKKISFNADADGDLRLTYGLFQLQYI